MEKQYKEKQLQCSELEEEILKEIESQFSCKLDKEEYLHIYQSSKDFILSELDKMSKEYDLDYELIYQMFSIMSKSEEMLEELSLELGKKIREKSGFDEDLYIDKKRGLYIKFVK